MMTTQNAPRTARERARAELTREIAEEARRQLAASGANGLSLRAVAKELGMVSSAVYRYYPSRDDLLTALIIDAYDAVGAAAEQAMADPGPARGRWLAGCRAIRAWAIDRPHEYALIYGSPVPGYRAPEATIGPAARVPLAFVGVLAGAVADGQVVGGAGASTGAGAEPGRGALTGELAAQAATLSGILAQPESGVPGAGVVPPDMLVRGVIAWTQLFGMLSWELFGQFVGSFDPAGAFFEHAIGELATFVGLG
jgi:AcrR family transcriptional regulator